jgi:hypothetical protein
MHVNGLKKDGICQVKYLPTDRIPSDVLTKALGKNERFLHTQVILGSKPLVWTDTKASKSASAKAPTSTTASKTPKKKRVE